MRAGGHKAHKTPFAHSAKTGYSSAMASAHASTSSENTFAYWRDLADRDPEQAAGELYRRLETTPAEERRRAIAAWPSRDELRERFQAQAGAGEPGGGTAGLRAVPYLLKDLFDVRGELTGCSSRVLYDTGRPAEADSRVQREMQKAGGVYCGRTHMNEFAYGLDGKNAHFGDCLNPHDPSRITGGSSSGSAWVVGKEIAPLAFGTDTGGSVRVPASYCKVFGFRRGVDDWSADGVFPLARSFDTAGWFTATAEDMATTLRTLWEHPEAAAEQHADSKGAGSAGGEGLWYQPDSVPIPPELEQAATRLAEQLGTVRDDKAAGKLDDLLAAGTTAYNVIGSSDAYEVHKDWLDEYGSLYDPVVWALIDRGRHWSAESLEEAHIVRDELSQLMCELLTRYAFIAMPATPMLTPLHEQVNATYRSHTLQLSVPASLAGLPALTIPVAVGPGRSGGVQIILPCEPSPRAREILGRAGLIATAAGGRY